MNDIDRLEGFGAAYFGILSLLASSVLPYSTVPIDLLGLYVDKTYAMAHDCNCSLQVVYRRDKCQPNTHLRTQLQKV